MDIGADSRVGAGETLDLLPGVYGEVEIGKGATLNLSSGHYIFEKLKVKEGSLINLDLLEGPITVDVVRELKLEGVQMQIVSTEGSASSIMFRVQERAKLSKGSQVLGTYLGFEADVAIDKDSTLEGALYGKKVEVEEGGIVTGAPAVGAFIGFFIP